MVTEQREVRYLIVSSKRSGVRDTRRPLVRCAHDQLVKIIDEFAKTSHEYMHFPRRSVGLEAPPMRLSGKDQSRRNGGGPGDQKHDGRDRNPGVKLTDANLSSDIPQLSPRFRGM